ncbi:MAG: peptidoglycan-associated lipoprotein Pal [Sphingorhabdus sp.]
MTFSNNKIKAAVLLLASTALVTACGKKEIDDLPPVADGTQGDGNNNGNNNGANAVQPGSQQDFVNSVGIGRDRVFFDTDRYNIDAQDQVTLQTQAQWLARYPNVQATIEGHADERGTRDYNLALGERRANAAKNYLVSLGIGSGRIRTVSYGKERPSALGSNEQSWAQNRRAVTVIVN